MEDKIFPTPKNTSASWDASKTPKHMGRHTIINPQTGRRVYKTGAIGRKLSQGAPKVKGQGKSKSNAKAKSSETSRKKRCYVGQGSTERPSPLFKTSASGAQRFSARAMYDMGNFHPVIYGGKMHVMKFRANGSPFYKAV